MGQVKLEGGVSLIPLDVDPLGHYLQNIKGQNELLFGLFGPCGWQEIQLWQNKSQ